jgi:NTP pyrophosphatase (non-canonical NTP hydrolase)
VSAEVIDALKDEGGDILWQLMCLFAVMDWDAESIAQRNLAKLRDRAMRNVIIGEGDNR